MNIGVAALALFFVGSAHAVSFNEALARLVQNSTAIKTSEFQMNSADVTRSQDSFLWSPSSITLNRSRIYAPAESGGVANGTSLQGTWNLFHFGADYYKFRASDYGFESARWSSRAVRVETSWKLALTLIDRLAIAHRRRILENLQTQQEQLVKVAQARYNKGLLSLEEAQKSEIDLESAKTRLVQVEQLENSSIETIRGQIDEDLTELEWPWPAEINRKFLIRDHDLELSPAIKSLEAEYLSSSSEATSNKLALLPKVDLTGSKYFSGSDMVNGSYAVTIAVSVSLWSGFTDWAGSKTSTLKRDLAKYSFENKRKDLSARKNAVLKNLNAAQLLVQRHLKLEGLAEKLLKVALRRFEMGRVTANDLFVEQQRYVNTEEQLISSFQGFYSSLSEFCLIKGQEPGSCR